MNRSRPAAPDGAAQRVDDHDVGLLGADERGCLVGAAGADHGEAGLLDLTAQALPAQLIAKDHQDAAPLRLHQASARRRAAAGGRFIVRMLRFLLSRYS